MKKVLIFAVVLILAAAVIVPKIVGVQFSSGIHSAVDTINKNAAYKASITSVESGWFNTKAQLNIGFKTPELSGIDFSIDVDVIGNHGPFILNDGFAIALLRSSVITKSDKLPEGLTLPNNDAFYQFGGLTSLFGTTTYQDSIGAIQYIDPENEGIVSFTGMTGNGQFSSDGIQYESAAAGVTMNLENVMDFEIQNITLDLQSSESIAGMLTNGLYDSHADFSIEQITFKDLALNTEVSLAKAMLTTITAYDKPSDLGDIHINASVATVDAPNMNVTDFSSVIEIKNLQAKFILAYQDLVNNMADNAHDYEQLESALDTFTNTYLLSQLQAKPEYNLTNISGNINGSSFTGNIMTKVGEVTQLPESLSDQAYWVKNIVINSEINMGKDVAEFIATRFVSAQLQANPNFMALSAEEQAQLMEQQIQGTIQGLIQQGMIIQEGEDYNVVFTLQDGTAMLNETQIPL